MDNCKQYDLKRQRKLKTNKLLPLLDPSFKQMAVQTEEIYKNFMLSKKGQEIQKKIYQLTLVKEFQENNKAINLSVEQKSVKYFILDQTLNESIQTYRNDCRDNQSFQKSQLNFLHQNENIKCQQIYQRNKQNERIIESLEEINQKTDFCSTIKYSVNPNLLAKQQTGESKNITINNNHENSLNNVCVICFDKQPDTVYMPCGHGGICYDCAVDIFKKTGECYLCRIAISQLFQVDIKAKEGKNFKVLAVTQIDNNDSINPKSGINIDQESNSQQHQLQNESFSSSFQNQRQISQNDSQTIKMELQLQLQEQSSIQQNQIYLNPQFQQTQEHQEQQQKFFSQQQKLQQQDKIHQFQQQNNSLQLLQNKRLQQEQIQDSSQQNCNNIKELNQTFQEFQSLQIQQFNFNTTQQQQLDQENIESKSCSERIKQLNTLNAQQNQLQNQDNTQEIEEMNKISSIQINSQNQLLQLNQNLKLNFEVKLEVSNELIILDTDEDKCENIEQKDDHNQNIIKINTLNTIQYPIIKQQVDSFEIQNEYIIQQQTEQNIQNPQSQQESDTYENKKIRDINKDKIIDPNLNQGSKEQNQNNNDLEAQLSLENS